MLHWTDRGLLLTSSHPIPQNLILRSQFLALLVFFLDYFNELILLKLQFTQGFFQILCGFFLVFSSSDTFSFSKPNGITTQLHLITNDFVIK